MESLKVKCDMRVSAFFKALIDVIILHLASPRPVIKRSFRYYSNNAMYRNIYYQLNWFIKLY